MNWYAAQYDFDPAADNVFGREGLRLRRDAELAAWLKAGGRVSDYVTAAPFDRPRVRTASQGAGDSRSPGMEQPL